MGLTSFLKSGPIALQQGGFCRGGLSCVFVTLSALSRVRFDFTELVTVTSAAHGQVFLSQM